MIKDKSINEFIKRLQQEIGNKNWVIADHWDSDLFAIGIAQEKDPRLLVYVSTYGRSLYRYDYECEIPDDEAAIGYRSVSKGENVDFKEVVSVLKKHIGIPSTL